MVAGRQVIPALDTITFSNLGINDNKTLQVAKELEKKHDVHRISFSLQRI